MNNMNNPSIIKLEHGSGGALSRELIEKVIFPRWRGVSYPSLSDATGITVDEKDILMTTDSYVVDPLFFPGGDIGTLAVFGTCNDLAVSGARPRYLSLGLILEEGLLMRDLERVLDSVAAAAKEAGVSIVTGDTKVVPAGKGGGIYINTCGIGTRETASEPGVNKIKTGDVVFVSAPIGAHGITVLAEREKLAVAGSLSSDCGFLYPLCKALFEHGKSVRFLRDATRGGVSAVLNEIVMGSDIGILVQEKQIPVSEDVSVVAKLLGLQPIEIANEGVIIGVIGPDDADAAIQTLRQFPLGEKAAVIGEVTDERQGKVIMQTRIGGKRIIDLPRGLLLPRIC